jgi:hypothetical protein
LLLLARNKLRNIVAAASTLLEMLAPRSLRIHRQARQQQAKKHRC